MNINLSELKINETVLFNPNTTREELDLTCELAFDLSHYQRIANGGKWDETPFWLKQDQQQYWVELDYRHGRNRFNRDTQ